MHERLSFFVKRESPIHRLNPMTKVVMALSLVLIAFLSPWYWTPLAIFLLAIIPLTLLAKVAREYWSFIFKVILPTVAILFLMQALFLRAGYRCFPVQTQALRRPYTLRR